ncbi:MAG TPA: bifunctional molybdenum cofactor biosynthesis protein MoaC/MoaB [Bacteroidia bacterium]|mgnify:CR=1 FL=1|nr:bifunctional molybdenum cofactor biosynthesis protein MoaC/MoaB [Bacteroidia bacterium]MBP7714316.1 bifunctional molybdenum cofactor biosynthesis protein MoaC/MoaB [Bacteroidia bacterium]MBP8669322.1 bifunctional molybdenum cofactor biosynthesis protein MoaC/MoaB [Bacteroidia bacterium]HOZ82153.1 bifunctional molybdenum cofactor biosynthesis protein MoaC/MoaB [Bacteroidia bacterium]HOZ90383.1 bifunctional molybdenum cofactor biosynthesis protein MoaC/MoaB [Bacteroidia bacterium]
MINITHKNSTHRTAIAQAIVKVSKEETITAVKENKVPKGNVFEMSKTAGLFAAKRTSDMIPDCHPLPIEYAHITHEINGLEILIRVEIQTIYKTGVEVEAMHAASVVALTIYDMLKPIDKNISIEQIKLIEKKGGKSDFIKKEISGIKAAVIVCSDSISKGTKEDKAGKAIIEKLKSCKVDIADYIIIPDEKNIIQEKVRAYCSQQIQLVILTGGTGLSPRDITPEALDSVIEKRIPGIEEAIRTYGQERTPYSMLSRSIAGLVGNTLVLALPGSTRGAAESMEAVFPHILHIFRVMKDARHD